MMRSGSFSRLLFPVVGVLLAAAPCSLIAANTYQVHNLVSDIPGADKTDTALVNPWGIALSPTSPFWISDNHAGLSTLYSVSGTTGLSVVSLRVTIPVSGKGGTTGSPTGIVAPSFYGATGFQVAPGANASFIFASEDGTISGWANGANPTQAIVKVDKSASNAVYKGLALGLIGTTPYLYAANFNSGAIDVFDTNYAAFSLPNGFKDPAVPAGFAPFNIQNLGGKLYVTYAKQDTAKTEDVAGAGNGYVSVFDTSGTLLQHLVSQGNLNSPWGLAIAPAGFGDFANDLLVGNFGDGKINVYDPATGKSIATLQDLKGNPIAITGLWALQVGNGASGGDANAIYFTAGIAGTGNREDHGLFGSIQAAPAYATTAPVVNGASFQSNAGPNTFITIKGQNLAATTRGWQTADFVNGALPTTLDGVSVTINGKPAYVNFISPGQINVLTPADTTVGSVQVQVTNNGFTSITTTATLQAVAPAFFMFSQGGGKYIAATHADNSLLGPTMLLPNNAATPAKPGDTIVLYATGFGATNPAIPDGKLVTSPAPLVTTPTVTIGGAPATVTFAGLTGAGLYQINVVVPASTADGDQAVVAQAGGQSTQTGALISVQH
ncbi:MAG: TIGR03118 family protein [Bryobacteraceae bacterium]